MGSIIAHSCGDEDNAIDITRGQPGFSAKNLLDGIQDGWFTAGGDLSRDILTKPGKIWGYSTDLAPERDPTFHCCVQGSKEMWLPHDGSFGSEAVINRRISAFAQQFAPKQRLPHHSNTHDDVSALAGMVLFYDYDFNTLDKEDRVTQVFDLTEQRDICGFAFLPAPLSYYPIGKNYIETTGPHHPYLVFAVPEDIIVDVKVDGTNIEYVPNPISDSEKCFLTGKVKKISDISTCRKIPLLFTARESKVVKWKKSKFLKECLNSFANLLKALSVGKHSLEVSLRFTYNMNTVGILDVINTKTVARGRWGKPLEDRFILGEMKMVDISTTLIKPEKQDIFLSASICTGSIDVIVPEKSEFKQCMGNFFGFGEQEYGKTHKYGDIAFNEKHASEEDDRTTDGADNESENDSDNDGSGEDNNNEDSEEEEKHHELRRAGFM